MEEWLEIVQRAWLEENAIHEAKDLEHSKTQAEQEEWDAQQKRRKREEEDARKEEQRQRVMKDESVQRHSEKAKEKEVRTKMEMERRIQKEAVRRTEAEAKEGQRQQEMRRKHEEAQKEAERARKGADPVCGIDENETLTHYEVLGISAEATPEQIKKAYRKKALQCHPDKNPQQEEKANRCMQRVVRAYTVLTTERERYDQRLTWSRARTRK